MSMQVLVLVLVLAVAVAFYSSSSLDISHRDRAHCAVLLLFKKKMAKNTTGRLFVVCREGLI
jgi:hypothetical protein